MNKIEKQFEILTLGLGKIVKEAQDDLIDFVAPLNEAASDPTKVFKAAHAFEWMATTATKVAAANLVVPLYIGLVNSKEEGKLLEWKSSPMEVIDNLIESLKDSMLNNRFTENSSGKYHNAFGSCNREAASWLVGKYSSVLSQIRYEMEAVI